MANVQLIGNAFAPAQREKIRAEALRGYREKAMAEVHSTAKA
jgi:hypothetical protein